MNNNIRCTFCNTNYSTGQTFQGPIKLDLLTWCTLYTNHTTSCKVSTQQHSTPLITKLTICELINTPTDAKQDCTYCLVFLSGPSRLPPVGPPRHYWIQKSDDSDGLFGHSRRPWKGSDVSCQWFSCGRP